MIFSRKILKNGLLYAFILSVFLTQKTKNLNLYALSNATTSSSEQKLIESLSSGENSSSDLSDENKENSVEQNISYEIYSLLCEDSKLVFRSADQKKLKEISKELKSVYEYLTKNYAISPESYDIADMSVISILLKNGIIDSEQNDSAKKLSEAIETYKNYEKNKYDKNKYDKNKYNSMQKASEEFGNKYKKSASCNPENVVLLKENKSLNNCPIVYDENILISLNDAANLSGTNPEIKFMANNAAIVIKFNNNKILEIEQGKNKAQLDDIQTIMENSVLNIDGLVYVPASILNLMSCKIISYNNTVIIY